MQYITQGVLARTRTTKPSRAHPSHHLLLPEFLKSRYAHPLRGWDFFPTSEEARRERSAPLRSLVPSWVHVAGGADRDRTGDPLLAKQVLSQLSYSPDPLSIPPLTEGRSTGGSGWIRTIDPRLIKTVL